MSAPTVAATVQPSALERSGALKVALIHAALVIISVLTIYPVLWVIKMALNPSDALSVSVSPLPEVVTLENFRELVGSTNAKGQWLFGRWLLNSLLVSIGTTAVGLTLAVSAAYALSRFKFPLREGGLQALLVTQMFPATLMMVPVFIILKHAGLLDNLLGLVLVYSTTSLPFSIWNLKGYFDTLPKELEEAAVMDGASTSQIFFRVVLPLARPALAVTALFSFMTAWNEFILAATLMNDETHYTLPVALQRLVGEYNTEFGLFAAGALIVSAPVMALFFALQKHLVGGLTAGGVKG